MAEDISIPSNPYNKSYFSVSKDYTKSITVLDSNYDSIVYQFRESPHSVDRIVSWKNGEIQDYVYHLIPVGRVHKKIRYEGGSKVTSTEYYLKSKGDVSYDTIGETVLKIGTKHIWEVYDSLGNVDGPRLFYDKNNRIYKMEGFRHGVYINTMIPQEDGSLKIIDK